jgi:chlorite dismutase
MAEQSPTTERSAAEPASGRARIERPDLDEKGGLKNGEPQRSSIRLYMQLLVYGGAPPASEVGQELSHAGIETVVYEDLNDPTGVGVLGLSERPDDFIDLFLPAVRAAMRTGTQKPEFTMFGRTYALGYEPDLQDTLTGRPRRTALNPDWRWAIWYPLRRSGGFARLTEEEQRRVLAEHGAIGMAFGAADYVHDVRLACHGLDQQDNDFVIGLIGKDLFPLSAVVQTMRKTQQTSLYLDRLGPFFVGRKV